jgi:hypothetical protein
MTSWAVRIQPRQYAEASRWLVPPAGLVQGVALAEPASTAEGPPGRRDGGCCRCPSHAERESSDKPRSPS